MRDFPFVHFLALMLFACTSSPATEPSAPATPSPSPTARPEIVIDRVSNANPVRIEGTARTFENNVAIRLKDARGRLMVETFTTSEGEIGHHNPFVAEVFVTADPGGSLIVEALEYSAKDGAERSLTRRTVPYDVPLMSATLFLPDAECTRVNPVTRMMPRSVSVARLLVEALMREPAPFPRGAAVRSINARDGVVTVDFNERLQNVGGSCAALMIRQSVERTLDALPTVDRVVITANGSSALALQP